MFGFLYRPVLPILCPTTKNFTVLGIGVSRLLLFGVAALACTTEQFFGHGTTTLVHPIGAFGLLFLLLGAVVCCEVLDYVLEESLKASWCQHFIVCSVES